MARTLSLPPYAFVCDSNGVARTYNIMNELNNLATQINQTNITSEVANHLGRRPPKSDQPNIFANYGIQPGAFSTGQPARGLYAGGTEKK